jgi:hypothetical protein
LLIARTSTRFWPPSTLRLSLSNDLFAGGWVGDYQITGKHGHVLVNHPGYLLYVTGTVQRWKKAKRILPGTVTQDGDDEGILRLDRLPTSAEAEAIRDVIGIRRRRHLSPEALAQARSALEVAAGRAKSPVPEPGSAQW